MYVSGACSDCWQATKMCRPLGPAWTGGRLIPVLTKQEIMQAADTIPFTADLFTNYSRNVEYNLTANKTMPKPQ